MIKFGLALLGLLSVAAPVGYKFYKDLSNEVSTNLSSSDAETEITSPIHSPEESVEVSEPLPESEEKALSDDQNKILGWASSNGGCRIKVHDENSGNYTEISKLQKNFDLDGLFDTLTSSSSYFKGSCEISNPNYGYRSGSPDAVEGLHFKKSDDKWIMDEGDE